MSQELRTSPRRGKSPSRIPLPSGAKSPSRIPLPSSAQRKRPAPVLASEPVASNVSSTPKALSGFRRLEALAKADVKSRSNPNAAGQVSDNPWVDKHLPKSLGELFVHHKKVEDVSNWLSFSFKSSKTNKICVLSGPAGCGKTATIHLVAQSLEADIKEWSNPMSLTDRAFVPGEYEFRRDEVQGRTEIELFKDFLEINSHYRILPINGKKMKGNRVIIVEDLPNGVYRDPNSFHEILRSYKKTGTFPLVFILTDSVNSDHSMYKLFPKHLMMELNIHNISFNPVASSLMTKFLTEICSRESKPIDRSQIQEIAETANGDLRCAVNNLQFFLTKERGFGGGTGTFRKPAPKRSRAGNKNNSIRTATSEVQQKDDTIQLFRALGKVLYAKRDETSVSDVELQLVGEMESQRRIHPLQEDPDNIVMKIEVSADTFLGFLHQNYPSFFGSMDDLHCAAEYLSTADFILSGWKFDDSGTKTFKTRDVKEQVSLNVAIRGLMHSNNQRISCGWKPLNKPVISNLANHTRDSTEGARQALYHLRELQNTLFTETIPFYAKLLQTKASFQIDGRKEILEKGLFKDKLIRVESLDEKETVDDGGVTPESSEDGLDSPSETEEKGTTEKVVLAAEIDLKMDSDEEFNIEEFDD